MAKSKKLSLKNSPKNGFTLVELLVTIAIVAMLSVIFTDILVQFIRGSQRAKVVNHIKNSGQVILDNISRDFISGTKVVCNIVNNPANTNTIVVRKLDINQRPVYVRYRYYAGVTPTSNGRIARDTPAIVDETTTSSCTDVAAISNILTDTDVVNGVSVSAPAGNQIFSILRSVAQTNDRILIEFYLRPGVAAPSTFESLVGTQGILFSTSVQLRTIIEG